ncbi:MAG TPA: 2,3-bisphosphoglycerate-independent phosphoglycerate mutase [Gemmatimonadaceae bacterium]|jgi:2,3-bisphosphoglycerate-independent phosphoglycerate mutase|nr:2,3-bisphosphoglycerate-independent phosphoglycerate mutase [Gemmatimonadaceae bacterium]
MATSQRARPVALIVLDGWGYRPETEGNAIALAKTPVWDSLWKRGSRTLLEASGLRVGLPEGQMGNSEVGHLNLGAGRVVMQDLVRISTAIADGSFYTNPALVGACRQVKQDGGTLHLMGLIGAGGVHAIDKHLFALLELAKRQKLDRVAIHAFLDGRDTLPKSALGYMQELLQEIRRIGSPAKIASVSGRYYSMDRDKRWDRTELGYKAVVLGEGTKVEDPLEAIRESYASDKTDEFMLPVVVAEHGKAVAPMRDGDAVIGFNYRSDRMRQIVRALIDPQFDGFDVSRGPKVSVTTLTNYDKTFDVPIAFEPTSMVRILAEVLSSSGLDMLKTAETEKYPHVTYFFNGGVEAPFPCEHRVLVPSPKVATYDLKPEMSAAGVTDALVNGISAGEHDFILCNYANADMVGHSGSIPATIKAVETVDECLSRVLKAAESAGTRLIVTADHGNAEMLIDPETGGPHTAHTTNPVPFVVIDWEQEQRLRQGGALCDVAPTILSMLGVEQPPEMTGVNLGVD